MMTRKFKARSSSWRRVEGEGKAILSKEYTSRKATFESLRMMDFSRISACAKHGFEECWYHNKIKCTNTKGSTHFSNPIHFPLILGGGIQIEICKTCSLENNKNCIISNQGIRYYIKTKIYDKPPTVRRYQIDQKKKLIEGKIDLMGLIIDSDDEIENYDEQEQEQNENEKASDKIQCRKRYKKRQNSLHDPDSASDSEEEYYSQDIISGPGPSSQKTISNSQYKRRRIIV
ncbi:uncharacterized protein I206_103828 [Kwoniella pini CBS 10737]|uniref:Uncharacterized protein n=1 Tax=Kwoniella pini CBS 10737 TaxID=1296096 RepID=A0A1B9HSS7_9TREE|nr:uncharacterized protein I206_07781 [Kwoniella pini CBS 10737]OCF46300.1 hypothetical protein I206_07781 [Kwoniella pini CBS 10737]